MGPSPDFATGLLTVDANWTIQFLVSCDNVSLSCKVMRYSFAFTIHNPRLCNPVLPALGIGNPANDCNPESNPESRDFFHFILQHLHPISSLFPL